MIVRLPEGYKPSEKEAYMNENQLEYFRQKLLSWKEDLLQSSQKTIENLSLHNEHEADVTDQAKTAQDLHSEIRSKARYFKLIRKIEAALKRVETKEYGYCEISGEPIGIGRLEARPVATLTIDVQEQYERKERQHQDHHNHDD